MIVLGMGFGDEGKGLATSWLCSNSGNPLVVRFNGGHQAGHTVVYDGRRHVFSSYGSGSLQNVPTYWSRYCTLYPVALVNESIALGFTPQLYVDPLCPVTTPFDVMANQNDELNVKHGSVGVGFGKTLQRHEEAHIKLCAMDLFYDAILMKKLCDIAAYYKISDYLEIALQFVSTCKKARELFDMAGPEIIESYSDVIYEGAQGIMLDKDFGFFPNVTRSNTTSKNAFELNPDIQDVYYVTRTYATRHGNGWLPGEKKLELKNNEDETNKPHEFQGDFRTAPLNADLLNYAFGADINFGHEDVRRHLIVTCTDQLEIDIDKLLNDLHGEFETVYVSKGPSCNDITEY